MEDGGVPLHYVCTKDKARDLIETNKGYWVSGCGCVHVCPEACIEMVARAQGSPTQGT